MGDYYEFPCGCKFKITNKEIKQFDNMPHMEIDYYNIPLNCKPTWELIMSGKTQGVFQLESYLGKNWAQKVKPDSLLELAALTALIRPGCLNAFIGDRSLTQHYVDRKNGEKPEIIHDELGKILSETQHVLTYQEQSLEIVKRLAGFNLEEADILRRALGKKDAELMAKVKEDFVKGCLERKSCTKEQAEQIFSMIKAGERYSFNKSHGVEYGLIGYWSAYVKAHFPLQFFCAWLRFAKYKMDANKETRSLVKDAKRFGLGINTSTVLDVETDNNFYVKDGKIYFGLSNIKKVGTKEAESVLENIHDIEQKINKKLADWIWYDYLVHLSDTVQKDSMQNMIACGVFNHLGISRNRMLQQLSQWRTIPQGKRSLIKYISGEEPKSVMPELVTDGRKRRKSILEWTCYDNKQDFDSLADALRFLLELEYTNGNKTQNIINSKRDKTNIESVLDVIESPTNDLKDTIEWINNVEQEYLSTNITFDRKEECLNLISNITCEEFDHEKPSLTREPEFIITGEVSHFKEHTIKNGGQNDGKNMCFLDLDDETGLVSCIMFPDLWNQYNHLVFEGNMITIQGYKTDRGSFCIVDIGNAS